MLRAAPPPLHFPRKWAIIIPMAKIKHADRLITMRCTVCKRRNYYTNKNKKVVERKIELQKFCEWCRAKTLHKEARITGK